MDYEEKYKDALERARESLKDGGISQNTIDYLTNVFPELKEFEDESIKKALIFYLGDMPEDTELRNGITNRDVLAWLEKQGEQKPFEMITAEESLGISSEEYNKIVDECIYGEYKSK